MKNTTAPIAKKRPAWFKQWFDSSFYHKLYAHRDEKEAANFIDTLLKVLQPPAGASMLDLGCGAGRHAKCLAAKGFNVTGTDLALSSIRTARQHQTSSLQFHQHDMRLPFGNNRYDYIFNFFTSFGYFETEDEDYQVIKNICNALKPGGTFVIDYINVIPAEEKLVPEEVKESDGVMYKITRWSDNRFFYKKILIMDQHTETPIEFTEQVAKFTLHDFADMFRFAGLKLEASYGNYDLNAYESKTSPRLILTAKK